MMATTERLLFGQVNENTHLEFISSQSGRQQRDLVVGEDMTYMGNELYHSKSTLDAELVSDGRVGRNLDDSGTGGMTLSNGEHS